MKAAVFQRAGKPLIIQDITEPWPEEGEVKIEVRACGICGSELHGTEFGIVPEGGILGHEFSGVIKELGPNVFGDWQIGDRVTSMPMISCGKCEMCLSDNDYDCLNSKNLGDLTPDGIPGAYAEYSLAGSRNIIKLPDSLSFEKAALTEPLATGIMAVQKANLRAHDNVLIIGAGPIGLAIAIWARFFGVGHVIVSEQVMQRADMAMKVGATDVIDANEESNPVEAFIKRVGRPPEVIFEAVGIKGMIQRLIEISPSKCRLIIVGVCMEEDTIKPFDAILKDISLRFVIGCTRKDLEFIVSMLSTERINVAPMITHRVKLDDVPEAFEALRRPTNQCKVLWTAD